jgi:hypothetical protein
MGVPCPRCDSKHTTHSTRRIRSKYFVSSPIVTLTCLECGYQWSPGGATSASTLGGCGGCLLVVVLFIVAASLFSRNKPDEPAKKAAKGQPAAPQDKAVPFVPQQPGINPVEGYKEIAKLFSYGADELAVHGAETKNRVATLWMRIKGISSDEDFGQWLVGLMQRAEKPPADKFEEADRLVAQGQLQFALSLAGGVSSKTRSNLREVSGKLRNLFGPTPKVTDASAQRRMAVKSTASVPAAKHEPEPRASVKEKQPAPTSREMAAKRLRAMLSNARNLIKAKVYPPARKNLQGIIDEAPGTPEADEAKTLLDSIPK